MWQMLRSNGGSRKSVAYSSTPTDVALLIVRLSSSVHPQRLLRPKRCMHFAANTLAVISPTPGGVVNLVFPSMLASTCPWPLSVRGQFVALEDAGMASRTILFPLAFLHKIV
jgi:hypothetical protein